MRAYGTQTPVSAAQALNTFLRSLNVPPEDIPLDLTERASLYRSLISGKRLLIVIDNVAAVKQLESLLPGTRQCVVLVTSRSQLAGLVARSGATRVTIDVLTPEEAVLLLEEIIGDDRVAGSPDAARTMAELCGYLPLSLRVVAERIASRPYLTLNETVRQLVSEQNRLDAFASAEDELADVRAVFSWSYHMLSSEQRRTFRLLGLHTGAEFCADVAATIIDEPLDSVRSQLQELVDVHLVHQVGPDRYRLHDLLRAYSYELCQHDEPQRARTQAVRRMLTWYLLASDAGRVAILPNSHAIELVSHSRHPIPRFDTAAVAMAWFEQERLNLLAALQLSLDWGQYDLAWKLPVVLDGFFELLSYWTEWKEVHEDGLSAAEALGDAIGEASNLLCLGDAYWRLKNHDKALDAYQRSGEIARRVGDDWLSGFALRGAGLIEYELGELEVARSHFEQALRIFRQGRIRRGEGMALLSLGKWYSAQEDLMRGKDYCAQAVDIFAQIGDRWSEAWGTLPLAQALAAAGNLAEAGRSLRAAVAIFVDHGDKRSAALALEDLGTVLVRDNDPRGALEAWNQALAILERLNDSHADDLRAHIRSLENEDAGE